VNASFSLPRYQRVHAEEPRGGAFRRKRLDAVVEFIGDEQAPRVAAWEDGHIARRTELPRTRASLADGARRRRGVAAIRAAIDAPEAAREAIRDPQRAARVDSDSRWLDEEPRSDARNLTAAAIDKDDGLEKCVGDSKLLADPRKPCRTPEKFTRHAARASRGVAKHDAATEVRDGHGPVVSDGEISHPCDGRCAVERQRYDRRFRVIRVGEDNIGTTRATFDRFGRCNQQSRADVGNRRRPAQIFKRRRVVGTLRARGACARIAVDRNSRDGACREHARNRGGDRKCGQGACERIGLGPHAMECRSCGETRTTNSARARADAGFKSNRVNQSFCFIEA
jgi:hypothetical protein